MADIDKPSTLILFSGGRDSTLVACEQMLAGNPVVLFTADNKCSLHRELLPLRIEELRQRFGSSAFQHILEDISGTFRSLALEQIETDILHYKKNLVLLGEKLAIHVHAALYCRNHGITKIYDGCVSYQDTLPEQRMVAITLLQHFAHLYGLHYSCPIYHLNSEQMVKSKLLQLGLSTKSLEGISIFADTFSHPTDDIVSEYLKMKIPEARDILTFMLGDTDHEATVIQYPSPQAG